MSWEAWSVVDPSEVSPPPDYRADDDLRPGALVDADTIVKKLRAQSLVAAIANLMTTQGQAKAFERVDPAVNKAELLHSDLEGLLKRVQDALDSAPQLKVSRVSFNMLAHKLEHGYYENAGEIAWALGDLGQTMLNEIHTSCLCMIVDPGKEEYWERIDLFDAAVAREFPDAVDEITEAGNCFASGRNTACVFHLMRAVESALQKWITDLGVTLTVPVTEASVQELLTKADHHLQALGTQQRTQQRSAELEYFGETLVQFRSFKDAWRNHVAHVKKNYDERKARSIFNHVKDFMETVAARPRAVP